MARLFVQDRSTHKVTHREYTDEGFLRVPGRVAKTGIQEYLRSELELPGNPNQVVKVFRPPEEVFDPASLSTYDGADITYLHPKKLVDSETFAVVSKGLVRGSGRQDGDFVIADLVVKDSATIKKIESGTVELSAGYTAEYVNEPGVTADGVHYDYVQRGIRINHVAFVPAARAGRQARIFDTNPKGKPMSKVTLDSGREVEIQDEAAALLISDTIDRLKTALDAAHKAKDEAETEAEKAKAKADALEEEAEKKKGETADSVIADRLAQIVEVKDKAKEIDSAYTADGVDTGAIMRGVLASIRPTVDWASKSDDYVQAAFDMAHEAAKSGTSLKNAEQLRKIATDGASGVNQPEQNTKTAYDSYKERMTNKEAAK